MLPNRKVNFYMPHTPEQFIPFAEQLANIAGEIIHRYFRQQVSLKEKADMSPVTAADEEAERNMRALIHNTFPGHGILGEEFGAHNVDAEYVWVLDPIDGTKSFMIGRPIFGTLIGLVHKGVPVLGIIDQPILGERWIGVQGFATNFNYNPVRARACKSLDKAVLCTTSPYLFEGTDRDSFERVREATQYTILGGDCYSYGLLASGLVDIIIETGLKPHDYCALVPVIKGAGGTVTDWEGKEVRIESDGRIAVSGDAALHKKLLKLLQ